MHFYHFSPFVVIFEYFSLQSVSHLLADAKDLNKALMLKVDDYKQKLHDAQGDIKVCHSRLRNISSNMSCHVPTDYCKYITHDICSYFVSS